MEVRIGVTDSPKELEMDLDASADKASIKSDIESAVNAQQGVLWLTDRRGRTVGVPASKIAYVEFGSEGGDRRIGFVG